MTAAGQAEECAVLDRTGQDLVHSITTAKIQETSRSEYSTLPRPINSVKY